MTQGACTQNHEPAGKEEERGQAKEHSNRLSGIGNDDLFFPIRTERWSGVMGADEVVQTELVIGIHKNGIDPQLRLAGPADRRQPHREGPGLPRNMQVQLE